MTQTIKRNGNPSICRAVVLVAVLAAGMLTSACSKTWQDGGTKVTLSPDGTLRVSPQGVAYKTFGGGAQSDVMTFGGRMFDGGNERTWRRDSASITALIIEEGVTHIGRGAFEGLTALKSVTIPNTVTAIADRAFAGCVRLTSVTIPDSVKFIGDKAFEGCAGLVSITIPGKVKSIGKSAFESCRNLATVTIQSGVKSIGDFAFAGSNSLTSITIPRSVTSIGEAAFDCANGPDSCPNVKSITIPEGVVSIGKQAFRGLTGLTSVTIPKSVVYIGEGAFRKLTGLISVTIPENVVSIGEGAFGGCKRLTSINVNDGNSAYISVGGVLFNKAQDTLIQYPASANGSTYTIPNKVKTIGKYAFSGSNLTSVIIPNSVKTIGVNAFSVCNGLTSVIIPQSVTFIGDWAFGNCPALTSVTSLNPIPPVLGGRFEGEGAWKVFINYDNNDEVVPKTDTLYVPKSSITAYKQAPGWSEFKEILPIAK